MANIGRNLVDRLKLGRRIGNSRFRNDPKFDSMMEEIEGSRTEQFATNMLEDAAGTTRAVAIGESAIEVGGLGIWGWIILLFALLFLLIIASIYLMPLFKPIAPSAAAPAADAIGAAPSEETNRALAEQQKAAAAAGTGIQLSPSQQLNKAIIERGGAFPGMASDGRPSLRPDTAAEVGSPLDEAGLQRERLEAITSGDTARYNQLIDDHKALYKKHGVDACASGFFPQGCQ